MARINLHGEVETALLERGGDLGDLLALCEKLEAGDVAAVQEKLHAYSDLNADMLNKAQLGAPRWAK